MPKVPQYQSQIQESSTPNVSIAPKTTVENFGGGEANVIKQSMPAVEQFKTIYDEQRKKADEIALTEAEAKLAKLENDLLYDKDNGALHKQGKAAFDTPEYVNTEYEKRTKEIESSLGSDQQRAGFTKLKLNRQGAIERTLNSHVGKEIVRHDEQTTMALIGNERNNAIKNYTDPLRVEAAVQKQKEALAAFGQRNGFSEEELQKKMSDVLGKTHVDVIQQMLADDQDERAQKYFAAYKDQITGDYLTAITKEVDNGSMRGQSQRFVDKLIKDKVPMEKALEEARKKYEGDNNAKLREKIEQRIEHEYKIRESAKKLDLEKLGVNGLNMIDQGQVKDVTKIPGWTEMDYGQREHLEKYLNDKISGKSIKTDFAKWTELRMMATTPATQDKFLQMDPLEYRNYLSNEDYKAMVNLRDKLASGDKNGKKQANGIRSRLQIAEGIYKTAMGVKNEKNLTGQAKEHHENFLQTIDQANADFYDNNKRDMNEQELTDFANKHLAKIVTDKGVLWDTKKRFNELKSEDDFKAIKYDDIPKVYKVRYENILRQLRKPVSPEAVRQMFIDERLGKVK